MTNFRSLPKWAALFISALILVVTLASTRPTQAQSASAPGARPAIGVARALVMDIHDPSAAGRIKVKFPWLPREPEVWAPVSLPLGGNRTGLWALPEIGDEVLVGFEHGDVRAPVVIGSFWNGEAPPPCERCS